MSREKLTVRLASPVALCAAGAYTPQYRAGVGFLGLNLLRSDANCGVLLCFYVKFQWLRSALIFGQLAAFCVDLGAKCGVLR